MSYELIFVADFGASQTGLTLNAKLYNSAGAQVGSTIVSGFVEIGNGAYSYLATIPAGHRGTFVIYKASDAAVHVTFSVNPEEGEYAAGLVAGVVTINSAVSADGGTVTLYRGDDYLYAAGNALSWSGTAWSLTGGTVNFYAGTIVQQGTITAATAFYVPLTGAQTLTLAAGHGEFLVRAVTATAGTVTILRGDLIVELGATER